MPSSSITSLTRPSPLSALHMHPIFVLQVRPATSRTAVSLSICISKVMPRISKVMPPISFLASRTLCLHLGVGVGVGVGLCGQESLCG